MSRPQLRFTTAPVLVLLSGFVGACSDDGDPAVQPRLEAAQGGIIGLWDLSAEGDELFMEITDDDRLIYWQTPEVTDGGASNCYYAETYSILPLGEDRYVLQQESGDSNEPTTIVRDGPELVFSFVDRLDDDDDGDVEEVVEERFQSAEGLSSADFNVCTGAS